jgi:hypothetical protein
MDINEEWKRTDSHVFWGEIAPCDHVVQIYEDDHDFLDLLSGFASDGFRADDCVIVIATAEHLQSLANHLEKSGINVANLISCGQYIPLDANETLAQFMVNGWPDANRFNAVVTSLLEHARKQKRQVRAFGEMVAILWAKGSTGATVQLEDLWNKFIHTQTFTLFCAYPKSGFTEDAHTSMQHICSTHNKVIASGLSKSEVLYKSSLTLKAS